MLLENCLENGTIFPGKVEKRERKSNAKFLGEKYFWVAMRSRKFLEMILTINIQSRIRQLQYIVV